LKGFFISLISMTEQATLDHIYQCYLQSTEVCTDTRKLIPGCFFVALNGANFNGNTFAVSAFEGGAQFVLMDDQVEYSKAQLNAYRHRALLVDNTLTTLQNLATHHRRALGLPILALTGSNGKTTTKELIHAVLSKKFNCIATTGNFNNHIGVPLTLLRLTSATELAVVEMGANHQGEIGFLCGIAEPNFGYITNFGKAHLEGFGGIEGVIKGKSELIHHIRNAEAIMFVDPRNAKQMELTQDMQRICLPQAQEDLSDNTPGKALSLMIEGHQLHTQLIGSYNQTNVLAAIAVGRHFKIKDSLIFEAIAEYLPKMNRSQLIERGKYRIIMDAYNANPSSMAAALSDFGKITSDGSKCAILGDMFELGSSAKAEHQSIVSALRLLPIEKVYLVGEHFNATTDHDDRFQVFKHYEALEEALQNTPIAASLLLIKGSRGMALERLLNSVFKA
jgi:UDP-N-acetylmuramoyl-tripeptide--D-alanyl-D-alanine ligase